MLTLTVNDNGKGITPKQINNPQALGLIGIRERAFSLDGKAEIKGIKGKGTTVIIQIPVAPKTRSRKERQKIERR